MRCWRHFGGSVPTSMAKKRKKAPKAAAEDGAAVREGAVDHGKAQGPPTARRRVLTHRCSSVGWMPSGVTSLSARAASAPSGGAEDAAAGSGGGYIAVGRENGNVEVWALDGQYCCHRLVGGDPSAAETVCWTSDGRVISAGLQGTVTLWDLASLRPAETVDSYGGAVWDMAFCDATDTLAIACEDGCVRLFDYDAQQAESAGGCLTYRLALAGFNGRSLSVAWAPDGQRLFAGGSDGTIRRWTVGDLRPGSLPACDLIVSTNTGGESGEATLIWALAVAADSTVVSGDSKGFTKFWDTEHGTLNHEFRSHVADVLTLAVGNDGKSVFSSGADPAIVHFQCVDNSGGEDFMQWVLSAKQSAAHTHDVRALEVTAGRAGFRERIWSGGVDTIVCSATLSRFSSSHRRHWPPCVPGPVLAQTGSTAAAPLMLFHHDAHLEVWRMGTHSSAISDPSTMLDGQSVEVSTEPRVLVELRPKAARTMTGSSISPDGRWVVCTVPGELKLFRLTYETSATSAESVRVQKVLASLLPIALSRHASGALAFSANSQQLIVGTVDGKIVVLDLNTFEVLRSFTVELNGSTACALSRFILSADGVWLAALDTKHRLRVYNLDSMQHHATLPVLDGIPTSFAFDAGCGSLVVGLSSVTSKKQLFVYNVEGGARADDTSATAAAARAEQFRSVDVPGSITGLAFDPDDPYAVLCTGVNFLARATVRLDGAPARTGESTALHGTEAAGVSVVTRLHPLLHAAVTGPSALLTIERRWVDVVEQLPEPIVRPKYGT